MLHPHTLSQNIIESAQRKVVIFKHVIWGIRANYCKPKSNMLLVVFTNACYRRIFLHPLPPPHHIVGLRGGRGGVFFWKPQGKRPERLVHFVGMKIGRGQTSPHPLPPPPIYPTKAGDRETSWFLYTSIPYLQSRKWGAGCRCREHLG